MVSMLRSWWQKIKQHPVATGVIGFVVVVVIALVFAVAWFNGTGFDGYNQVTTAHTISGPSAGTVVRTEVYQPGKSLWDWLQLLIVPIVISVGGLLFNLAITRSQEKIASDNRQEAALQGYLDHMTGLLLMRSLPHDSEDIAIATQRRTLTLMRGLDANRKRIVLEFLHASKLLSRSITLKDVDLSGANLSGINLSWADLREANLSEVNLSGADLSGANLSRTDLSKINLIRANLSKARLNKTIFQNVNLPNISLSGINLSNADLRDADLSQSNLSKINLRGADLSGVNLSGVNLSNADLSGFYLHGADLSGASLSGANLSGANLSNADLRDANLSNALLSNTDMSEANLTDAKVTAKQLDKAKSLKLATMPDGTPHD